MVLLYPDYSRVHSSCKRLENQGIFQLSTSTSKFLLSKSNPVWTISIHTKRQGINTCCFNIMQCIFILFIRRAGGELIISYPRLWVEFYWFGATDRAIKLSGRTTFTLLTCPFISCFLDYWSRHHMRQHHLQLP